MKIAVLSSNPQLTSTQRLIQAAEQMGHDARIIDPFECTMQIASGEPSMTYRGEVVEGIDAIIPRVAASRAVYGLAVVRQFEMMGIYSINSSQAIARARDKLRSLQILSRKGVGLPVTVFAHDAADVDPVIAAVKGPPVVIKLLEGTQGVGVVLAETKVAARSVIQAFRGVNVNILVQEFIGESAGSDIRAFVVGERVVASMMRTGASDDFRANLHRGGSATKLKLTPEERAVAVASAKALGLRMAGVDLLRSDQGPLVIEVNASPGLEGIERSTEVDVASKIIAYLEKDAPNRKVDRIQA